jgi:hypothetical protein
MWAHGATRAEHRAIFHPVAIANATAEAHAERAGERGLDDTGVG